MQIILLWVVLYEVVLSLNYRIMEPRRCVVFIPDTVVRGVYHCLWKYYRQQLVQERVTQGQFQQLFGREISNKPRRKSLYLFVSCLQHLCVFILMETSTLVVLCLVHFVGWILQNVRCVLWIMRCLMWLSISKCVHFDFLSEVKVYLCFLLTIRFLYVTRVLYLHLSAIALFVLSLIPIC